MREDKYYGTGRRKTAIARVWLKRGTGEITINKREFEEYLPVESYRKVVLQPLLLCDALRKFDIYVNVTGGGLAGQAGAIRHGITRALIEYNPALKGILKNAGLVTRDPRMKERKKYGQRGARARYQYSKR